MAVGEIILSAFITVLFEKLSSGELLNFARREGIETQLKKLRNMLPDIRAVLSDAEDKQITDTSVKQWLDDLTDLAYDLDDVVDELATEVLRRKLMAEPQTSTSKVWKFIPTCCTSYTPSAVMFDYNMSSKIEELTSRLQAIETRKRFLNLKKIVGGVVTSKSNREETSLLGEPRVYGREKDKDEILRLLKCEASDEGVSVIPILGMGGIGKTTLANLIYNDDKFLKEYGFDPKAWACVSDVFDVFKVTETILQSVAPETRDFNNLNMLQEKLKDRLTGKKFLIVLDDIWNENYGEWEILCRPFLVGAPGSKIIITTRNKDIASITRFTPVYHLKKLSNDDCLSLLAQHSLGRRNFDSLPYLKEIGEKIAKKCDGLPLAAKMLGGLLRNKSNQNEWEDILHNKIWEKEESGIIPALQLSYHHLPSHLKQCFAYCSIFQKDYQFDKDELVLLWMAQGFLQQSKGKKRMEDFGNECFDGLLSRSFFQQSSGNELQLFVMHDLINDLARYVSREICFSIDDNLEGSEHFKISKRARHVSYIRQEDEVFQRFNDFNNAQHLRTFLPLPIHKSNPWESFYLRNRVLLDLWPKLRYLRVLSLSGYSMSELPASISDLKHLRYLNLSGTSIKCLPEKVNTLYNLQTLVLRNCNALCKLPSSIRNLTNLRHLDVTNTRQLQEMPLGIGKLTSLQTLSKIVVGKSGGLELIDLKNLSLLRGTLLIVGLQNVLDPQNAKEANLMCKEDLDELGMRWCSKFDDSRNENLEMDVLNKLKPHGNLKRLKIEFYGGMKFPSWIGDPSFSKIVNLSLGDCKKCTSLPPLVQLPMLKDLCVRGMHKVKSIGDEFYGDNGYALESLETLIFEDMPEWEEWSPFTIVDEAAVQLPRLRELTICCCPKLMKVSLLRLPSLRKLNLGECNEVVLESVVDMTLLNELRLENIRELTYLHEELMQFLVSLKVLELRCCDKLLNLWVTREKEECLPRNLEVLEIRECVNLEKLPNDLNNLTALRDLIIMDCPKLVSFPETGVPPMLRRLDTRGCKALEWLPNDISRLEHLKLFGSTSLPTSGKLPTTLESLWIREGVHFESVSETILQEISKSLKVLWINGFPYTRTLLGSVRNFENLVNLVISNCDRLESFPERGLSAPNLSSLSIYDCPILKSMPDQIQSLTSLTELHISDCPNLEFLHPITRGDFPPNLTHLSIDGCQKLMPLTEWSLHLLTSLRIVQIRNVHPELVSFPDNDEYCGLPATLTSLSIEGLQNLESLSSMGLQNLTSLKQLYIKECPKLRSLPKDGLLATLSRLVIDNCPLLKQRYLKDKGEYWHKIADIPCVVVDKPCIFE